MDQVPTLIKGNKGFFLVYAILLITVGALQLWFTQEQLFLVINASHNTFSDILFTWITYLGDGLFFIIIIVVLLFRRYWQALLGSIIFLSSAFIAQLLKRLVFSEFRRPFAELGDTHELYSVPGVEQVMTLSFPSGHTVTIFALAIFAATTLFSKKWGLLLLISASLIGFSRVYLGQHYVADVYFGSIIGMVAGVTMVVFFKQPLLAKFGGKSILNQ
jgi:membrane-associated phospholipid phosphatase